MIRRWFFIFCVLSLAGCAVTPDGTESFNHYVAEATPLNESGPYQTTPAATMLLPGMRVRIVNKMGNYVYVQTVTGQKGFIPVSALQQQREED